jgi:hypothetical protein
MSGTWDRQLGAEGAIMPVPEIIGNGALLVLSLEDNNLFAEGGKALAAGLKGNRDTLGIIALADVIHAMGGWQIGISLLSLESNNIWAAGGKALAGGLKGNNVITELNIEQTTIWVLTPAVGVIFMSGVIALADVIPDMGALSSLSLKPNGLLNKKSGRGGTSGSSEGQLSPH